LDFADRHVIMRPSYGLTRAIERSYHRHTHWCGYCCWYCAAYSKCSGLCGIGICFIGIRICIDSANYKFAAALITISIIFVYSLINPDAFEVIQYRVIDTIIGATIAVVANYILLPSWEANNLKQVLLNALK
jgi:uncharacterized membrane protein YccC